MKIFFKKKIKPVEMLDIAHKKAIPKRTPDCFHYRTCLARAAEQDKTFSCKGCIRYLRHERSMMTMDDMPGIVLLLRAIFFRTAHEQEQRGRAKKNGKFHRYG